MKVNIRLARASELKQVHDLIVKTINTVWTLYYPAYSIDYVLKNELDYKSYCERIDDAHFYVAEIDNKIVGCGGIRPTGEPKQSEICVVFVAPQESGKGIGRQIMETLENDKFAKNSNSIIINSSLAGLPFYKRLGYNHKDWPNNYAFGQFMLEKVLLFYKNDK